MNHQGTVIKYHFSPTRKALIKSKIKKKILVSVVKDVK